jgi:hypothetical protein
MRPGPILKKSSINMSQQIAPMTLLKLQCMFWYYEQYEFVPTLDRYFPSNLLRLILFLAVLITTDALNQLEYFFLISIFCGDSAELPCARVALLKKGKDAFPRKVHKGIGR